MASVTNPLLLDTTGQSIVTQLQRIGSMIAPTAVKSITANGTHDVTEYASAVVNVPLQAASTCVLEVTLASDTSGDIVDVATLTDPNLIAHLADESMMCFVRYMDTLPETDATLYILCGNSLLNGNSGNHYGSQCCRVATGDMHVDTWGHQLYPTATPYSCGVSVTSGNHLLFRGASFGGNYTSPLRAGTYRVEFTW